MVLPMEELREGGKMCFYGFLKCRKKITPACAGNVCAR